MMRMVRGIVRSFTAPAGKLARFTATGRWSETIEDREVLQHYGFQSCLPEGCEGLVVRQGNHILLIASDDRQYRIELKEGEVAIVNKDGDKVHLQDGRKIAIEAGAAATPGEITIEAKGTPATPATVNVVAQNVKLGNPATIAAAGGVVTVQCPCSITGAVHPTGSQNVKATLA